MQARLTEQLPARGPRVLYKVAGDAAPAAFQRDVQA